LICIILFVIYIIGSIQIVLDQADMRRNGKVPQLKNLKSTAKVATEGPLLTPWTHQFIEDEKILHEIPRSKHFSPLQKDEVERLIGLYQPSTKDPLAFDYELHSIHCLTLGDLKGAAENLFRATFTDATNPRLLLKRAYCEALLGDVEKGLRLVDKVGN
jgi:hypothetical protein